MTNIVKVPFYGDDIEALHDGHDVWISLKRMCENVELDYKTQHRKLNRLPWAVVVMMTMTGSDGKNYDMFMLHLDSVPMWLATIDASRVRSDVRSKLIAYQKECARVLRDHFFGNRSTDLVSVRLLEDRLREYDDRILLLLRRLEDQKNGLIGSNAADLRKRIAVASDLRKELGDPNASKTAVDNEVRAVVDYPRSRGKSWENCTAEKGARAHSCVAAMIDGLNKRLVKSGKKRQGNLLDISRLLPSGYKP